MQELEDKVSYCVHSLSVLNFSNFRLLSRNNRFDKTWRKQMLNVLFNFSTKMATLGSDWLTHCDFPSDTASWIFTKLDRKQAPDSFLRRLSFYPSTIVATLVFDLSTYHIMAVFSPTFLYISMTLNTRHKARHRRPLQRTSFSGQSINKAGHLRLWMTDTVSSPVNNCLDLNKTGWNGSYKCILRCFLEQDFLLLLLAVLLLMSLYRINVHLDILFRTIDK